jgi:hypothetical protein
MPSAQTSGNPSKPSTANGGGVMRMTIYFQQSEWDALQAQAAKNDTTLAHLVRKAVRSHLNLD